MKCLCDLTRCGRPQYSGRPHACRVSSDRLPRAPHFGGEYLGHAFKGAGAHSKKRYCRK